MPAIVKSSEGKQILIGAAGRNLEFDLARGLAVFFMIVQHVVAIFGTAGVINSAFGVAVYFFGTIPAAPIFLLLMGASLAFSRRSTPSGLFWRGLKLIGLGYLLSALRFVVPLLIGIRLGIAQPETSAFSWTPLQYLLTVDILQLAGLSLLLISLLKKAGLKPGYYLLVALIIALVSPLLWSLGTGAAGAGLIAAPFFGTQANVIFPFFSWAFYPLVGVYFGCRLQEAQDKDKFYKSVFPNLLPVILLGILFLAINPAAVLGNYYRHELGANLLFAALAVYWIAGLFFVRKRLPSWLEKILSFWSRSVTAIYFIQWLLIGWLAVFYPQRFAYLGSGALIIAILALSDRLAHGYLALKDKLIRIRR